MKNIHILPSKNNKSKLATWCYERSNITKVGELGLQLNNTVGWTNCWREKEMYITNDEEIKEGDLVLFTDKNLLYKVEYSSQCFDYNNDEDCRKIILTSDQDLIKEGVQAIPDEFLDWFIENPSCEKVDFRLLAKLNKSTKKYEDFWEIIIPEEEPKRGYVKSETELIGVQITLKDGSQQFIHKQETLEEAMGKYPLINQRIGFKLGAKSDVARDYWFKQFQQEQDRNKYSEEIEMLWLKYRAYTNNEDAWSFKEWLVEQFKKK